MEDNKSPFDVLKSRRFISFVVYLAVTYVLFPVAQQVFPEVFASINPNLFMENATDAILVLIGGYSAQDAVRALKAKNVK